MPAHPEIAATAGAGLRRRMGFRDLLLFYVVTGISVRWIASAAAAGPGSIAVWALALLAFFVPLVAAVVELSRRYPQEGGLYVWSRQAFGNFSGFMAAWIYWTSNLPYFPAVLYFAASNALFLGGDRWRALDNNRPYFILFALAGLALPTALHILGLNLGNRLNNAGAASAWLAALMVCGAGVYAWMRFGSATAFTRAAMTPGLRLKDMIFWSSIAFAFGGCEAASFMGDEIQDARRNIPRALLTGGAAIAAVYIAGTVCVLLALRPDQVNDMQGLMQAISLMARKVNLPALAPIAALLIVVSNIGAAGAYLAATARLPFVAGLDRFLPAAFGSLHPKYGTPWVALLTQSLCSALFIFLGQAGSTVKAAYDALVSVGVITYFIPYLLVFAAVIRLRLGAGAPAVQNTGTRALSVGLAALGFATTALAIGLACIPAESEAERWAFAAGKILGLTALSIAPGVVVYAAGKRRRAGEGLAKN